MIDKRRALITGGAAGIGAAITRVLCREGVACTITGRAAERPDDLDASVGYCQLDFLAPETEAQTLEAIRDRIRPDILINNAGINEKGPIGETTRARLDATLEINLAGPYRLTQACLPHMLAQGWGRILNVTSIWSVTGNPGNTAYCASKFGLDGFSAALAAEVARHGVLVNCIAPGYVLTETMRRKYQAAEIERIAKHIPIRRMAEPEEIAELSAWLVSERNTYVTGQNIRVDGGLTRTAHPWREW